MDWLDVGNIGNIAVLAADVKLQITADAGNTAPYWTFNNDGTLFVPGNISGDNSAPLIVEGSGSGEGYISLPHATFGGEQVAIVNKFGLGNGIRLETNGGNLFFDNTGDLTASGNVTAENFIGNISITGNVQGTSANVTLVAGSYDWTFDNTGNLTLPGNTFSVNYANNTPVDIITRFEGSWNVATGNSTVSFTVDPNESYQMWVEGNIPNGIIAWNATATITNTNVPVVGAQYAWVYDGGGSPIDFTSIPNQFIGTSNTIVRSNVAPSTTTNRFDFGINNASGNVQVVRYGWIKIS
jgi:cytoskeletal protein CcmA (bactofilin family)